MLRCVIKFDRRRSIYLKFQGFLRVSPRTIAADSPARSWRTLESVSADMFRILIDSRTRHLYITANFKRNIIRQPLLLTLHRAETLKTSGDTLAWREKTTIEMCWYNNNSPPQSEATSYLEVGGRGHLSCALRHA